MNYIGSGTHTHTYIYKYIYIYIYSELNVFFKRHMFCISVWAYNDVSYYDLYINEKTTHELKACHYEKDGTITSYSR